MLFAMRPAFLTDTSFKKECRFDSEIGCWYIAQESSVYQQPATNLSTAGLSFYIQGDREALSIEQFAQMLAGFSSAYTSFCEEVYKHFVLDSPDKVTKIADMLVKFSSDYHAIRALLYPDTPSAGDAGDTLFTELFSELTLAYTDTCSIALQKSVDMVDHVKKMELSAESPSGVLQITPLSNSLWNGQIRNTPLLYDSAKRKCLGWNGLQWNIVETPAGLNRYKVAGRCFNCHILYNDLMSVACIKSDAEMAEVFAMILENVNVSENPATQYIARMCAV